MDSNQMKLSYQYFRADERLKKLKLILQLLNLMFSLRKLILIL
jgi:hypothetical protein